MHKNAEHSLICEWCARRRKYCFYHFEKIHNRSTVTILLIAVTYLCSADTVLHCTVTFLCSAATVLHWLYCYIPLQYFYRPPLIVLLQSFHWLYCYSPALGSRYTFSFSYRQYFNSPLLYCYTRYSTVLLGTILLCTATILLCTATILLCTGYYSLLVQSYSVLLLSYSVLATLYCYNPTLHCSNSKSYSVQLNLTVGILLQSFVVLIKFSAVLDWFSLPEYCYTAPLSN